ncbi:MAG: type IV pilus assembly protein PilM [Planctomycetota bacterium]
MIGKSKKMLALDIGSHSIKALEVVASGPRLVLTGFAYAEIPEEADRFDVLRRVVHENYFRGHSVVSAVSGRNVIVRFVPMQKMSPEELKSAIRFEADKYIPFGVDEVQLDCAKVAEIPATNEVKVLLVAVKKTLIDEQYALLREVGLVPAMIDVDAFALGNAFFMSSHGQDPEKVTALVDVGSNKTSITIVEKGVVHFAREVYVAGNDFSENIARKLSVNPYEVDQLKREPGEKVTEMREAVQPAIDDLANEIALSFDFFENESEKVVSNIYLSGGGALLPGLDESFAAALGKPTSLWNPVEVLENRVGGQAGEKLTRDAGQFAISVGLASRVLGVR